MQENNTVYSGTKRKSEYTGSGEYVDKTATLGKEYAYSVQAFIDKRESDLSKQAQNHAER